MRIHVRPETPLVPVEVYRLLPPLLEGQKVYLELPGPPEVEQRILAFSIAGIPRFNPDETAFEVFEIFKITAPHQNIVRFYLLEVNSLLSKEYLVFWLFFKKSEKKTNEQLVTSICHDAIDAALAQQ